MTTETNISEVVSAERVILSARGQRVILSSDLAEIYGVTTKALNQAVRRNSDRFPPDFAFQLTREEAADVQRSRSQTVTLKRGQNIKYLPLAFAEHGAIMEASVLSSPRAVQMSVFVVRAFLRLRELAAAHVELAARLKDLEQRVDGHDEDLQTVIEALRHLLQPDEEAPRRRIGFGRQG